MAEEIKTKKLSISEMVSALKELNSNTEFKIFSEDVIEFKGVRPAEAKYPEGYYYSPMRGITNEENATSDEDIAKFRLMTVCG